MAAPADKAGVKSFLGFAQCLSKILPHLSDINKPLKELALNDVESVWDNDRKYEWKLWESGLKHLVFRHLNLEEEMTLQCDTSQSGLGAALLQNGQPVAHAFRALSAEETRNAQIENEVLEIVFAFERFDIYVYGRVMIRVESDHKPLQRIFQKPLTNSAPKWLQRMLVRLQKYSLNVAYKKGKEIYLANTRLELSFQRITHPITSQRNRRKSIRKHSSMSVMKSCNISNMRKLMTLEPTPCNHTQGKTTEKIRSFRIHLLLLRQAWPFNGPERTCPQNRKLLLVTPCIRKELIAIERSDHIEIEGSIRGARDSLFWPVNRD